MSAGSMPRLALTFALVVGVACWLPYHLSLGGLPDNNSLAVAAGFDQRVAILAIVGVLMLASGLALLAAPPVVLPAGKGHSGPGLSGPGLDRSVVAVMAAALFVLVLLFFNGSDQFNEISYYTDRQALMAQGQWPYRDFLFNYGPASIALPWLAGILLPGQWLLAYLLVEAGFLIATILLLRHLVQRLPIPDATRGLVFLGLALFWLPLSYASGLHYAGLRFVVPVVLAFHGFRLRDAGATRLIGYPLVAVAASFALGIEVGVVMLVMAAGVLMLLALAERRITPLLALIGIAVIAALLFSLLPAWLASAITANFSGREFPLIPNMFLLFFLFNLSVAALVGLPPLLRAAWQGRLALGDADFGLCLVAALALLLLPGAIGRADFNHLFAFGLPAFVVTAAWAANAPAPRRLVIFASILIQLTLTYHALNLVVLAKGLRYGEIAQWLGPAISLSPSTATSNRQRDADSATIAARYPGAYDPFLLARPRPGIITGYYSGMIDVIGPYAIGRKRAELAASTIYLIPADLHRKRPGETSDLLRTEAGIYTYLALWPWAIPMRQTAADAMLNDWYNSTFDSCQPIETIASMRVCRNRGSQPRS